MKQFLIRLKNQSRQTLSNQISCPRSKSKFGAMAEWLRRGLQSLVLRFDPGWHLQIFTSDDLIASHSSSGGGTVDTRDLKSLAAILRAGSIPAPSTTKKVLSPCDSELFSVLGWI